MANKSLTKLTDEEFNKRLPRIRIKLRRSARANHRYKNRTGRLTKSIGTVYNRKRRRVGMVAPVRSINYNIPYAQYVINGHGSWLPDPFLEGALDRESDYMQKQFQEAIYNGIGRYNKQRGKSGGSVHSGI